MMAWLLPLLAGGVTGVLSAFGIGGGSLLLIYLTSFAALDQHQAQGINLLYFLPAAAAALPSHAKNGLLEQRIISPGCGDGLSSCWAHGLVVQRLGYQCVTKAVRPISAVYWPDRTLSEG